MPTGPLPYPDKHFDLVYSAEVLVHVRPDHVDGILKELVRVCRGHVFHLETSEHVVLYSGAHEGCWRHDLPAAYDRLGLSCEVLPSGSSAHTPYRVAVGQPARFTWSPALLEMYRRMERDIDEGFAKVAAEQRAAGVEQQQAPINELRSRIDAQATAFEQQAKAAKDLETQLHATLAELESARATMAALTQTVEAQAASAESLAASAQAQAARADGVQSLLDQARADGAAQGARCEQLVRQVEALTSQMAALKERMVDLEVERGREHAAAATLLEQRREFVESVSRHLRG